MKLSLLNAVLTGASFVLGHGIVYKIQVDGTIYPGSDMYQDQALGEAGKRIAFPMFGNFPQQNISDPQLVCGTMASPAGRIADARAGSNVTMYWSPWLASHKGPLISWLAPYQGEVEKVNLNQLKFFKMAAQGRENGVWATDSMMANNHTWTAQIPADIKPGQYVLRHELLALHFATKNSNYWYIPGGKVAPQFYVSCWNINVVGSGTETPEGVTFPGGYKVDEPGLVYDIFKAAKDAPYPIPGPPVYKSKIPAPSLEPKPLQIVSPTGNEKKDGEYYKALSKELAQMGSVGGFFNSIGG